MKKDFENMTFLHCDNSEKNLTLHDCIADRAYFEDGKLIFEFDDGFWIGADHPENNLNKMVRTDFAKVEFVLVKGEWCDGYVYVFERTFFKRTVRKEMTLEKLVDDINRGKCKLEFLYQYVDENSRMIDCMLRFDKRPYFKECWMMLLASEVNYLWNNLCADREW